MTSPETTGTKRILRRKCSLELWLRASCKQRLTSNLFTRRKHLKQRAVVFSLCVLFFILMTTATYAQQVDFAIGGGTVSAPPSNVSNVFTQFQQSLRGGFFLTIGGNALI